MSIITMSNISILQRFSIRHLLHSVFPKSLSTLMFKKHRKDTWLVKFSVRCIIVLHKMWLERRAICHQSTNATIRVEDHNAIKSNVLNILEVHEEFLNELETHRGKVDLISSELLQAFLCEFYALTRDRLSSSQLTNHTLNEATHCRADITSEASELRCAVTKIGNDSEHKSKQLWLVK